MDARVDSQVMADTILSEQQEEILDLLNNEGHTWKSAADELGISQSAFETQMARIAEKGERAAATLDRLRDHLPDDSQYDYECEACGQEFDVTHIGDSAVINSCNCSSQVISLPDDD